MNIPDYVAELSYACPCGYFKWRNALTTVPGAVLSGECPYCGRTYEVIAGEIRGARG